MEGGDSATRSGKHPKFLFRIFSLVEQCSHCLWAVRLPTSSLLLLAFFFPFKNDLGFISSNKFRENLRQTYD